MHVWRNGVDWVVAEDASDASAVSREHYGDDCGLHPWQQVPDDHRLRIMFDEGVERCGCWARVEAERFAFEAPALKMRELIGPMLTVRVERLVPIPIFDPTKHGWLSNGHHRDCPVGSRVQSCAEWVVEFGRGLLCSTEW